MKKGIVEFWNNQRGFGFLGIDRNEKYFFHVSEVRSGPLGDLTGLECTFDFKPSDDPKKLPIAINVRIEGGAK